MLLKRIKEIIEQYLQGTHSELQQRAIDSWLDKLQSTSAPHTAENLEHIRDDMWHQIKTLRSHKWPNTISRRRLLWQTVASIAAVLLAGFLIFPLIGNKPDQLYHTGPRETKEISLADGSTLKLHENTRLSVSRHFKTDTIRQVDLHEGGAFFDVAKDPTRPFIIKNKLMQTEVLGTSFTIRSLDALGKWNIHVKTGHVRVSQMNTQDEPYILLAGEDLYYDREKNLVRYTPSTSTSRGDLVFQDEHLEKVMWKLAKRYNRPIHVPEDIVQTHQFSGEFDEEESFLAVLDMICIATNTQYHLQGDTIVLSQKE